MKNHMYTVLRQSFGLLLILFVSVFSGCSSSSVSVTQPFTEIVFPEVEEVIHVEDFDAYPIMESFEKMSEVKTEQGIAVNGALLDSEGNLYGRYTVENTNVLGKFNLMTGESEILHACEDENDGFYVDIRPCLLTDDFLVYEEFSASKNDSSPLYLRLYYLDLQTDEKTLIEEAEGISGAVYAQYDGEGIIYSHMDSDGQYAVYYRKIKDDTPVKLLSGGYAPFYMNDEYYCLTYSSDGTDPEYGLARFDPDGNVMEIEMKQNDWQLYDARKLDDTHMLLVCMDSASSKSTCRLYTLDIESAEVNYLFDVDSYMECIQLEGRYLAWRADSHKETLLDLSTDTVYQAEDTYITICDEGIAFNSVCDEEPASYEYWH